MKDFVIRDGETYINWGEFILQENTDRIAILIIHHIRTYRGSQLVGYDDTNADRKYYVARIPISRVAAALSARVIVFSARAAEITEVCTNADECISPSRSRLRRGRSGRAAIPGECNADATPRPGSRDATYAGQDTQKEEASRSVGDSC